MPKKASSPGCWDSRAKLASVIQVALNVKAKPFEHSRQHGRYQLVVSRRLAGHVIE